MSGFLHWFAITAAATVIVASYFAMIVVALVWLRTNAARALSRPINPAAYDGLKFGKGER